MRAFRNDCGDGCGTLESEERIAEVMKASGGGRGGDGLTREHGVRVEGGMEGQIQVTFGESIYP